MFVFAASRDPRRTDKQTNKQQVRWPVSSWERTSDPARRTQKNQATLNYRYIWWHFFLLFFLILRSFRLVHSAIHLFASSVHRLFIHSLIPDCYCILLHRHCIPVLSLSVPPLLTLNSLLKCLALPTQPISLRTGPAGVCEPTKDDRPGTT